MNNKTVDDELYTTSYGEQCFKEKSAPIDFNVEIGTRITMYQDTVVTVSVTLNGNTLSRVLSGLFLCWRIERTVKDFKKTLRDVTL